MSLLGKKSNNKTDAIFSDRKDIELYDAELWESFEKEMVRQEEHIELIASENYASQRVLQAQGSVLTNKYAEGYPDKRYYGGCEFVDIAEKLAIERAKELFNADYANVQPHSGSSANAAAYLALLEPNDAILGMSLDHGGHLTHGSKVNFSGRNYKSFQYGLNSETHDIDYDQVRDLAKKHSPKLIIAGFSAFSGLIDWSIFREIADEVNAYFLVDMAHISGLVAGGCQRRRRRGGALKYYCPRCRTRCCQGRARGPPACRLCAWCEQRAIAARLGRAVSAGLAGRTFRLDRGQVRPPGRGAGRADAGNVACTHARAIC